MTDEQIIMSLVVDTPVALAIATTTCPECHGAKELMYSCCSGDIVDSDSAMCPDCHEHLGLEPCYICDGEGVVPEESLNLKPAV